MAEFDKFEEYKLFVEDTARLSERRQRVTNIYIMVNGAILGLLTFLVKDAPLTKWWLVIAILPLVVAGIAVCWFWYRLLRTYKTLIDFRFEQLEVMERSGALPGSHSMYNLEAKRFFREAPRKQQIGFSRIEMCLPVLFMVLYVLMGAGLAVATWLVLKGIVPTPAPPG